MKNCKIQLDRLSGKQISLYTSVNKGDERQSQQDEDKEVDKSLKLKSKQSKNKERRQESNKAGNRNSVKKGKSIVKDKPLPSKRRSFLSNNQLDSVKIMKINEDSNLLRPKRRDVKSSEDDQTDSESPSPGEEHCGTPDSKSASEAGPLVTMVTTPESEARPVDCLPRRRHSRRLTRTPFDARSSSKLVDSSTETAEEPTKAYKPDEDEDDGSPGLDYKELRCRLIDDFEASRDEETADIGKEAESNPTIRGNESAKMRVQRMQRLMADVSSEEDDEDEAEGGNLKPEDSEAISGRGDSAIIKSAAVRATESTRDSEDIHPEAIACKEDAISSDSEGSISKRNNQPRKLRSQSGKGGENSDSENIAEECKSIFTDDDIAEDISVGSNTVEFDSENINKEVNAEDMGEPKSAKRNNSDAFDAIDTPSISGCVTMILDRDIIGDITIPTTKEINSFLNIKDDEGSLMKTFSLSIMRLLNIR